MERSDVASEDSSSLYFGHLSVEEKNNGYDFKSQ
jgi:hypothetical protein